VLCLANIGVPAKDRFWLLWTSLPGRTETDADTSSTPARFIAVTRLDRLNGVNAGDWQVNGAAACLSVRFTFTRKSSKTRSAIALLRPTVDRHRAIASSHSSMLSKSCTERVGHISEGFGSFIFYPS
jgi:hypothetical protein